MGKFLEKYNLPKLSEEEAETVKIPIAADKIEAVIEEFPIHNSTGLDSFKGEF